MHTGPEWISYASALLIAGIGWLVRSRQRIELLNFIRPERVADRAGLARFAGNLIYLIAALVAAGEVARHFDIASDVAITAVMVAGILASTGWLLLGAQDYMKP